jgi:hypothetical protein
MRISTDRVIRLDIRSDMEAWDYKYFERMYDAYIALRRYQELGLKVKLEVLYKN